MGTSLMRLVFVALALFVLAVSALPAPSSVVASKMNVTVINKVGKPLQIRVVDPKTGKKGGTICAMPNQGDTCTGINQDWVASATDGSWDAGDLFDQWWGDDSWDQAVATYTLTQGTGDYIQYKQTKAGLLGATEVVQAASKMNVTVINKVGKPLQIRVVDPKTGKKGGTICAMPNQGDTCTGIHQDWVAS